MEESILGDLRKKNATKQKIKKPHNKNSSSDFRKQTVINKFELKRRIDILSKILKLNPDESSITGKQHVTEWLQKLSPRNLNFELKKYQTDWIDELKALDLDIFTNTYLKEKNQVVQESSLDEGAPITFTIEDSSNLKNNQGASLFKEWEFITLPKRSYLRTEDLLYECSSRTFVLEKEEIILPSSLNAAAAPIPNLYNILSNNIDIFQLDVHKQQHAEFTDTVLLHILDKIKEMEKTREVQDVIEESNDSRIKGFVRPGVLILTTYRHELYEIVLRFTQLTGHELKEASKNYLEKNFITEEKALSQDFCRGIRCRKGIDIRKNAFEGDIVIASPSSLFALGESMESLLSSLHTLFLFNAENLETQNLELFTEILKKLNGYPLHKYVSQDFRLIHPIFLENKSKFFRQSIVLSSYNTNSLHALCSRYFFNFRSMFRSRLFFEGVAQDLSWQFQFYKFNAVNFYQEMTEKLNYFENVLWDYLRNKTHFNRALIHTNSYFEYQRIKKILKNKKAPAVYVSEHTSAPKVQSAMARFSNGNYEYIVTTERALFFETLKPKSFNAIIFYSVPFNPEVLEKLAQIDSVQNAFVFFGSQAYFELELLVGSLKASEFINSENKYKEFRL